jgi:signal transduction histidine kinase
LSEQHRDNLIKVTESAHHLLNLINDILDLSKIEAGRMEVRPSRFDVKGLMASCCDTVSLLVRPGVALNYEVADEVGEACTDEARLRQIVINLLSNAVKFTEKGEVRVKCQVSSVKSSTTPEHVTRDTGALDTPSGEGLLVIAVSDTGTGIPAEALSYIFEEFRQVAGSAQQQKGTGLGLSITKKLTDLLGGTIGVESEVGKGSTFTIRVPMVYAAEKEIEN